MKTVTIVRNGAQIDMNGRFTIEQLASEVRLAVASFEGESELTACINHATGYAKFVIKLADKSAKETIKNIARYLQLAPGSTLSFA